MRPKGGFVLLLLVAICILSVYSCVEAVPTAFEAVETGAVSYHTYRYSMKNITDIHFSVMDAAISFYTEPKREEIVVQVKGAAIAETKTEKRILLESTGEQACQIDVYLPERFYSVLITGGDVTVNTIRTMHGTLQIEAEHLLAEVNGYCGGISFCAQEGSVRLEQGNLSKASQVVFLRQGNIYCNTKITDTEGVSLFSTERGTVKVYEAALQEGTLFDVAALSVSGHNEPLDMEKWCKSGYSKVKILSKGGIVCFMD